MGIDPLAKSQQRAVFLDRDGVLNQSVVRDGRPYPPASAKDVIVPDDVPSALAALAAADLLLIGVSNQPDVARGIQTREVVERINKHLLKALPVEELFVCYHDDADGCDCRKPKPGLLLQAARKYAIHLPGSYMVGDRWKDIEAGRRAGCRTVLIQHHYQEKAPAAPDHTADSLSEAAAWILEQEKKTKGAS
jgi:D-glycero-D-manno-heptose 1,7-bisphosphate phosphatase